MGLVRRDERMESGQIDEVLALAAVADRADGVHPLSEPFRLRLRPDGQPATHLLVHQDGDLIGYGQVDPSDPDGGPAAELVVHPAHRGRGLGRALADAAVEEAARLDPDGRLHAWAHGDHPSASALGFDAGFERYRALWQMRRALPAPPATLPDGVRIRPFRPGEDEAAVLAVNGRAFADHPEQGRWTMADVELREREPWFDPDGLLLAVDADDRLLGFHWTKVHADAHAPIGEVYVLGIDPGAQGGGLGVALTLAGLAHLASRGLSTVMLYVDEDNPGAVRLYTKLGFSRWLTDTAFRR